VDADRSGPDGAGLSSAGEASWQAAAMDALDVGVILFVEGEVARFNRAAPELLRTDPERLRGATPGSGPAFVLSEVVDLAGQSVAQENLVTNVVLRERVPVERVVELRWADGASRVVRVTGVPVVVGGRNGAVVTYRDVTDEVGIQGDLRASERRLQDILDAVESTVFVKDLDGRFTFVNAALERNLGLDREHILGRTAADLTDPEETRTAIEQDREVLTTGETRKAILEVSGRHYLTSKSAVCDEAGRVVGLIGTSIDMTDQVAAQQARAVALAVVESTTDAIATFDRDLRVTSLNSTAAQDSNEPTGSLVGRDFLATFPFGTRKDEILPVLRSVLAGEEVELEYTPDTGVSRGLTFVVRMFPIRSEQGDVIGGAVMGRDVTESRAAQRREQQLERQVEHMDRLDSLGQLAGGVAHDFNNLLAAINLTAEMLQSQLPAGSEERDEAGLIVDIARRATDLTAQLLVFARKDESPVQQVDLNDVVRRAESLLARTLGEHIERQVDLCADVCVVDADPTRLEQVVLNLALNARDAMPDGGRLTIATSVVDLDEGDVEVYRTRSGGAHAVLTVSDDGIGMDDAVRLEAFDPFFTTKPTGKGTGLGLATVYGVARRTGGGAWIHSQPGRGTSVRVAFPLSGAAAPHPVPEPDSRAAARSVGRFIVVLEDEEALRAITERLLARAGYRVASFVDGTSLLGALPEMAQPPDLLLTDVVLPGASGPEVAERAQQMVPGLRVVLMSGYTAGLVGGGPAQGVVLAKPFSAATLIAAVERTLGGDLPR
jgi:two-component system cell cycle sensor histidine kinase/response regulator CckA